MADTSMYSNSGRGVQQIEQPDLGAAMQQGMNLRQMARQNRQAERDESESMAMNDAMRRNVGSDGKLNRGAALSDLARINPMKAMQYGEAFRKDELGDLDANEKKIDHALNQNAVIGQFLEKATDQASWTQGLQQLAQAGVDTSHQPQQFDPGYRRQSLFASMDMGKRLDAAKLQLAQRKQGQDYQTDQRKLDIEEEKLAAERNPSAAARLAKMGGEVKQKVGHITSGLMNLTKYESAFANGGRQGRVTPETPILGRFTQSTPIDEARTNIEEAIGRLASGGAINKDEEGRFRRMIPTAADDDATVQRKLAGLRQEMENKLTGYGFKTDELGGLGFNPEQLGYSGSGRPGSPPDRATPGGVPGVSSAYAAPPPPKHGTEEAGYIFMGGAAGDPKSWKKAR